MSRVSMFNSPLLLGFDQLERTLDRLAKNAEGYPPYNIERIGENGLRITLAVAGFTTDDLVIELVENQLTVRGKQTDDTDRVFPPSRHRRPSVPARFHAGRRHRGHGRPSRQRPAGDRPGAPVAEPRIRTIRIDAGKEDAGAGNTIDITARRTGSR